MKNQPTETQAEPIAHDAQLPALTFNPQSLMELAIREKSPIEALERLVALMERAEERSAKKAFKDAMAKFQAECPVVGKAETAHGKRFDYKYASFDMIKAAAAEPLKNNGLSYRFEYKFNPESIESTCVVSHSAGQSEQTTVIMPIDREAYMNSQQMVGSACTYGDRYAFKGAFGIVCSKEDDDANGAENDIKRVEPRREAPGDTNHASGRQSAVTGQQSRPATYDEVAKAGVWRSAIIEEVLTIKTGISNNGAWELCKVIFDDGVNCSTINGEFIANCHEAMKAAFPVLYLLTPSKKNPAYWELKDMKPDKGRWATMQNEGAEYPLRQAVSAVSNGAAAGTEDDLPF